MSVIITGMGMPKNCIKCNHMDLQEAINCQLIYSGCANCGRHLDCPLRSVEGLIKELENRKQYKGKSGNTTADKHDIGLDKYFDLGLETAIKIIKEYCKEEAIQNVANA